jgi:hypothetical protein
MANLNHLCRTLLHAMDTGKRDLEDHVVLQIRAALAQVEPEVCYEFVVSNDEGCTEAGAALDISSTLQARSTFCPSVAPTAWGFLLQRKSPRERAVL